MTTVEEMLSLFKGELTIDQILKMTYKEIGYLRELRIKRKKANGGADDAASALAAALTGQTP